jgi:hypothetical protein
MGDGGQVVEIDRRRNPISIGLPQYNLFGSNWVSGQLAHFFFSHMTPATRAAIDKRRASVFPRRELVPGQPKCVGMHVRGGDGAVAQHMRGGNGAVAQRATQHGRGHHTAVTQPLAQPMSRGSSKAMGRSSRVSQLRFGARLERNSGPAHWERIPAHRSGSEQKTGLSRRIWLLESAVFKSS